MTSANVTCPRCEARVTLGPEHLAPTSPPTLRTDLSLELFLKQVVGHRCDPARIQAQMAAELAKI
jgi:hypothetical protein